MALAWPDRIAQKRGGDRRYRLSGGGGAILPEHEALAKQEWLAVATTDGASGDQKIFLAAPLTLAEIETHFSSQIEQVKTSAGIRDRKVSLRRGFGNSVRSFLRSAR